MFWLSIRCHFTEVQMGWATVFLEWIYCVGHNNDNKRIYLIETAAFVGMRGGFIFINNHEGEKIECMNGHSEIGEM